MSLYTPSSPHMHAPTSVSKVMLTVLLALLPGIIAYIWFFGWGVVINMALAMLVAVAAEAVMLALRKRPLQPFLSDGSALLTGVLLALSIPPVAPWWLVVIGTSFAIVFAKHLYGGLGYNPFNPAMIGYAMLLISFPREMSTWLAPVESRDTALGFSGVFDLIFGRAQSLDGVTGATPLDYLKTQLGLERSVPEISQASDVFGFFAGQGYEWVGLGFLLGGLWLIHKKIISWHIPVAMIGSLALISAVFHVFDPLHYASPLFHIVAGATLLGAFFIATDPVSAATTPRGRIVYGVGIGLLVFVIRNWGGYPDAVAFAVLLMNICAPTIDYYTRPRAFGHGPK